MILLVTSIASSDQKKITDINLKLNDKAPFQGVLVHEDMYRYLRAEEQRAVELETEVMTTRSNVTPSKYSFMLPLSVGMLVGVVGASYLVKSDFMTSLLVGVTTGGLVAWSFK